MSPETGRSAALSRTLRLVAELLSGTPLDRNSAAELLGKKGAAADRQLKAIEKHVPGMSWDRSTSPRTLRFDRQKLSSPPDYSSAIAACFGLTLAPLFEGTQQESGMRRAYKYVLGQSYRRKVFRDIERKFTFVKCGGECSLPENSAVLDELIDAVLHSREIGLAYKQFSGQEDQVTIQPLSLCLYHHQIYIVGRRPNGAIHPFRFSRIVTVSEDRGSSFEYPTKVEYDPQVIFADSLGVFIGKDIPVHEVEIALASEWATYAQTHRWHPSQQIEIREDGSVLVRMRVRLCHELEAWVLGFGEHARVLNPPDLRDKIASRLNQAAALYP